MEFYYTPDTCALASLVTLYDCGADFTLRRISFASKEQKSASYLGINPKARVPALKIGAVVLTETPAILAYLAQSHPNMRLIPDDPLAFAEVQAINNYLCSTLHVAHAHRMRGHRWADGEEHWEAMRAKVPEAVGDCYAYLEEHVFGGPFVTGDTYTIADPYLFTIAQWMESDGVDPNQYPKIRDHRVLMRGRPTVVQALKQECA